MNLGIGVCIGDLSFANRTYNTNVVHHAKKLRDKTATDNVTKVYNSATERKQSSGGYQTNLYHPSLISSRQLSFPKRRVSSETLQDDITLDTRYYSRQRSLSGEPYKGEKSENEYSSTPSRTSLRKCIPKTSKQPITEKNENTTIFDGTVTLRSPIATDCRTDGDLPSKSKWKLVSEKLGFKQHPLSSSPRNIDCKQNDIDFDLSKKKEEYPTSDSYHSRHYSYDTPATEIRTNPKPIPDTLFDPSIFYITASKFCPCDHHDQLRKIQEDKILLARKARKRSERLKKKELRRKRQAASLSLSRSSSGSQHFGGKRALTVDILPSIPSLTVPISDTDVSENVEEACQKKSLRQVEDLERDGDNNEPNDISAGSEARYKLDTSKLPSSSSLGPIESIRKNRESKLVSRVLESVILDGCESTLDQTNNNHTVSGLDCEETNFNPHRKVMVCIVQFLKSYLY